MNNDLIKPASSSIKELNLILVDVKEKLHTLDPLVNETAKYKNDLGSIKEQISVGLQKSNLIMDKMDAIITDEDDAKVKLP